MRSTRNLIPVYLAWLAATYPKAFDPKRPAPLLIGTYQDLLADPDRPPWATSRVISGALAQWTRRPKYRRAVKSIRRRALKKEINHGNTQVRPTPTD